jgi:hypothetical protein
MNYDKNYLCYPFKVMRMTQGYYGKTSHLKHTQGTPKDYPIDEGAEDIGRNYMYCPCDEIEVVKIFNSTKAGQTNVVWYRSTSPVVTPTFTDYVVIMVVHMNDDVLSNLWIGKKFMDTGRRFHRPMLVEPYSIDAVGRGICSGVPFRERC